MIDDLQPDIGLHGDISQDLFNAMLDSVRRVSWRRGNFVPPRGAGVFLEKQNVSESPANINPEAIRGFGQHSVISLDPESLSGSLAARLEGSCVEIQ